MPERLPNVLSVAGFDPSGGAGVLADSKTFDQVRVHGCAVITAHTNQTEASFDGVRWSEPETLLSDLEYILQHYSPQVIKIGLIQDLRTLHQVVSLIRVTLPQVSVVWDPILRSSSGHVFHSGFSGGELKECLSLVDVITPNREEFDSLGGAALREVVSCLVTGIEEGREIVNQLSTAWVESRVTLPKLDQTFEKHGSGCVFSAALTGYLAHGRTLPEASRLAAEYTHAFLKSSDTLFGIHSRLTDVQPGGIHSDQASSQQAETYTS